MFNFLSLILALALELASVGTVYAGPSSANYELQEYSFGSGGTDTGFSSANYTLYGISGQMESGAPSSADFSSLDGLVYLLQSGVPPAPTLSDNGGLYYNKLLININYSTVYTSIPSDMLFAVAVSTDFGNPSLTKYVQADQALGDDPIWQSFTAWGDASGFILSGLLPDTTYYVKVAARQGNFTQTGWGPAAFQATAPTSLTFEVRTVSQGTPPFTLAFGTLTPGSVNTTSDRGQISVTTNANSGALIYVSGVNSGLKSTSQGGYTINSVSPSGQDLSSLAEGYGIRGTGVSQGFGAMEINGPYNGSGSNIGPADNEKRILFTTSDAPVSSGIGQFEIQAKASLTAPPASDYTDIITITTTASF